METETKKEQNPETKLDRKSKVLFVVLGILIIGSVAATYWRYMMKRDYIIQAQIDCDPETENCFIWKCDSNSLEEGEKCTGVPDNDIWYYKILNRNAKNIPDCDPEDENCTAYICGEGEKDCSEELCTPENVPEGEECNNPEQYLLENPPADESECDPDDEECLNSQSVECEEGDQECLDAQASDEAECPARNASQIEAGGVLDDQECANQPDSETGEISPASQDTSPDAAAPAQ